MAVPSMMATRVAVHVYMKVVRIVPSMAIEKNKAPPRTQKMTLSTTWHLLRDGVGIRHGDNNLQGFEVVKRCLHWLR